MERSSRLVERKKWKRIPVGLESNENEFLIVRNFMTGLGIAIAIGTSSILIVLSVFIKTRLLEKSSELKDDATLAFRSFCLFHTSFLQATVGSFFLSPTHRPSMTNCEIGPRELEGHIYISARCWQRIRTRARSASYCLLRRTSHDPDRTARTNE